MNNGCIYQLSGIESAISLMSPVFPETIKVGVSSSVTVQFRCDANLQFFAGVYLRKEGLVYEHDGSEGDINLMSPVFPAKIESGDSSSATVRFKCTATLHFYSKVFDFGPQDLSDSQYIDLRDHHVTGLMMKLNGREIFHAADSRIRMGQRTVFNQKE